MWALPCETGPLGHMWIANAITVCALTEALLLTHIHNMFLWRNMKNIIAFWLKKSILSGAMLLICIFTVFLYPEDTFSPGMAHVPRGTVKEKYLVIIVG